MYRLFPFDKMLCRVLRRRFDVYADKCDVYSIWHFCPNARFRSLQEFFSDNTFCQADWFPIIYWVVLAISALGSFYSLIEFISLYWSEQKCVSVWRQRKYYVLSKSVLRKCRLVGSLVMLNAWLLLCYAIVNVSPANMVPWLSINIFLLGFELITWIIEILVGVTKLSIHTMLTFLLPLTNLLFVRCVYNVFQRAIALNEADDLRLW